MQCLAKVFRPYKLMCAVSLMQKSILLSQFNVERHLLVNHLQTSLLDKPSESNMLACGLTNGVSLEQEFLVEQ